MSPNTSRNIGQSNITRRRTGCIPCRDKHVRCDETKPTCRRCERSSSECFWTRGIRIVFQGPEGVSAEPAPSHRSSISTTCEVKPVRASPAPEIDPEPELADMGPRPTNVALPPNPEQFTTWSNLEASDLVQTALRTNLEITLMHNYLTECAPWFDAHSAQLYYSRVEVPRMLKCPPWRAAALALSAKNIEMRDHRSLIPGSEKLSLHLYSMAVRLAIESMSGRFEVVGTVAGCVLLCVYEMMTVTYLDWRRHVQGCASIYTHNGWNGSSGGLISGCFWDFARIGERSRRVLLQHDSP